MEKVTVKAVSTVVYKVKIGVVQCVDIMKGCSLNFVLKCLSLFPLPLTHTHSHSLSLSITSLYLQ